MAGLTKKFSSMSSIDKVPVPTKPKNQMTSPSTSSGPKPSQGDNSSVPNAKKNKTEQRVSIASSMSTLNNTGDPPRRPLGRKSSNPLSDKAGEGTSGPGHKDHQVIKVSKSSDGSTNFFPQSDRPSQEKRGSKDNVDVKMKSSRDQGTSGTDAAESTKPLRRSSSMTSHNSVDSRDQQTLKRQMSVHESSPNKAPVKNMAGPPDSQSKADGQRSQRLRKPSQDLTDLLVKAKARKDSGASIICGAEDTGASQGRKPSLTESPLKSRFTFASVTQRVNSLLRIRKALIPGKPRADSIEEENVISATEVVQNLPKTPRFSSFMSAEAQFALMKGYEDLLLEKLEKDHQEEGVELRRNKTPHHKVSISDKTGETSKPSPPRATGFGGIWRLAKKRPDNTEEQDSSTATKASDPPQANAGASQASASSENKQQSEVELPVESPSGPKAGSERWADAGPSSVLPKKEAGPILENLRRMSLSFPTNASKIGQMGVAVEDTRDRRPKSDRTNDTTRDFLRSDAAKSSLTHSRRLIMSYRLESAMDILDQIKPEYEHTLSPRVKAKEVRPATQSRPVTEFNRWTTQWANEFTRKAVN